MNYNDKEFINVSQHTKYSIRKIDLLFYKDILYFLYELAQNVKISFLKIQLFMFLCVLKLTTSNELHCIRKVIYPWNILKGFYICLKV